MFRWDQWFYGLIFNALFCAGGAFVVLATDVDITKTEGMALAVAGVGGVLSWCKSHKPRFECPSDSDTKETTSLHLNE